MSRRFHSLKADEETKERFRQRILRNIFVDLRTGCWRWLGKKTGKKYKRRGASYPLMTVRLPGYKTPRNLIATRVSLEVFVGPPPKGHEAAHDPERCPYADCVNWEHLRWATRKENEADKRHPRRLHVREIFPPTHRLLDDEPADCPF